MPSFTLGPRMGMFLAMASVIVSFAGGMIVGAKTSIIKSLENEVTVLFEDSQIANNIRVKRDKTVKDIEDEINGIKADSDCANQSMGNILQLQSDFN